MLSFVHFSPFFAVFLPESGYESGYEERAKSAGRETHTMPKERTGSIVERGGKVYVRVSYTDAAGKKRELMRRAADRTDARKIIKQLLGTLDQSGERGIDGERMTFAELAEIFRERRLIPARYVGEGDTAKKAAGMRNWKSPRFFLRTLTEHFGRKRLRDITPADIERFKLLRLDTPTKMGTPRTAAAVNRELQLLRTALRYAVRQGWLTRSPFDTGAGSGGGEKLIDVSAENRRERVLSFDEEARLLAAIDAEPLRAHLRPLIIAAVDTAARRNELLTLEWRDVDVPAGLITVRAINAKTACARTNWSGCGPPTRCRAILSSADCGTSSAASRRPAASPGLLTCTSTTCAIRPSPGWFARVSIPARR
jgi:hypothetical protein